MGRLGQRTRNECYIKGVYRLVDMAKTEKQKRQEKLYEEWKRQKYSGRDSEVSSDQSPSQVSHSIERQQPRVQKSNLVPATTSKAKAEERAANRAKYPEIAAFVDECRRVFGPDVKVVSITPHKDPTIPLPDATDDLDG